MNAEHVEADHDKGDEQPRTMTVTLRVDDIFAEVGTLDHATADTWRPKLVELLREIAEKLADDTDP